MPKIAPTEATEAGNEIPEILVELEAVARDRAGVDAVRVEHPTNGIDSTRRVADLHVDHAESDSVRTYPVRRMREIGPAHRAR